LKIENGKTKIENKKKTKISFMKKLILTIIIAVAAILQIQAQINTNLFVSATPTPQLALWENRADILRFQVFGAPQGTPPDRKYKIKAELLTVDGTVVGRNDLVKAQVYAWSNANVGYNAAQVLQLDNFILSADLLSAYNKTGKLKPNNYILCVQLVNDGGQFQPVSSQTCRNFYVAQLQLPILMKPADEQNLDAEQAKTSIMFRWTPLVPRPTSGSVNYKILVFEILNNQNAVQAMRSNFPVLQTSVIGTTQYIWQPQGIITDVYKNVNVSDTPTVELNGAKYIKRNYVWTVQCTDFGGEPITDGSVNSDGVTEPKRFSILHKVKELSSLPK
jgi:hypothetical protein